MIGRAYHLLTGTADMPGMHADPVPAGRVRDGRALPVDPYVKRPFSALNAEFGAAVKGVTCDHPVVSADADDRGPGVAHDRDESGGAGCERNDDHDIDNAQTADFF
jgi:hypothetical protein